MSRNRISRDGGVALCKALKGSLSIRVLNLNFCAVQDEGAFAFAEFLSQSKTIQTLYLENNKISGTGLIAIAKALEKENSSLETIRLWGNYWDTAACEVS
jgi:Ran GTPase-activating protein (RanGAP) involved in mRNA processing and transport